MKKERKITIILVVFVVIAVLSMSIGYAAFNTEMLVSGEAYVRVDADIRISDLKMTSASGGAYETYNSSYTKDTTSMFVTLPVGGSITYEVTIKNTTDKKYVLSTNILSTSNNMRWTISTNDDNLVIEKEKTYIVTLTNNTSSDKESSLVLEYLFEEKKVNLTFDANGGSVNPTSKEVTYGDVYGELPTPTKIYNRFMGWYTDTTYKTQITETSKVTLTKDQTLYAKWEPNYYGVNRVITSSSSAWQRTGDSVGKVANAQIGTTAVRNDFDNIYPWSEIKSYNYDTSTKKITAWYGEPGFTFTPSGNIEVLTYIPEFYYDRTVENNKDYIQISKDAQEGFSKSEAFSVGRYTMSGSSSRVHSRSGVLPLVNVNITNFRNYAQALGSGFGQLDYHYFILQILYLVEYADYNTQLKLGQGNTSNSSALVSGGCNALGMKSGTLTNDGKHSMIYRGIEDFYGNIYQFVDGIYVKSHQAYINYNPATYYLYSSTDYKKLSYVNSKTDGFISKLGYDSKNQLVALPIEASGTATTGITDRYYQISGESIVVVGGHWAGNTDRGIFNIAINGGSSAYDKYSSARLLKTS